MKKGLKIFLIVLVLLIAAIIAVPFVFKNQLTNAVKSELGKQLDAEVTFNSVSISLFKNFPDLTLSLNALSIVKANNDTLISMNQMLLDMETWSAITGKKLTIKSLVLNTPRISYISPVLAQTEEDSTQMPKPAEITQEMQDTEDAPFLIRLDEFLIENGRISYFDAADSMNAVLDGINMALSGDFSQTKTLFSIDARVNNIYFSQSNETLIKGFPAAFKADIDANLDDMVFSLKDNSFILGVLKLELDGTVKESGENYNIDLQLNAPVTNMSELLKMLPDSYGKMLEGINTDGNIAINGFIKGDYVDVDHLPEFQFNFSVSDGMFQYPDLPKSINKININAEISHPDQTSADKTVIRIKRFACDFGGNPIESQWVFTDPVSDLFIDGFFKGNVDLATLRDVIPLEDTDFRGIITADVKLKGRMSAIENETYDKFNASGFMTMKGFWLKNNDVPQGLSINETTMNFSPKQIDLKSFSAKMGQSDFTLSGTLSNYINYVFSGGTLNGSFKHNSKFINANEFLDADDDAITDSTVAPSTLFVVPDKLNLVFQSSVQQMLFDNLTISSTRGKITVKDRKAILDGLKMDLLNGSMEMTGVYNSTDTLNVFSDMHLIIDNIDVAKTAQSFSAIQKLAPIATYAEGRVSFKMNYYSPFKDNGEVDMNRITSRGFISSPSLLVKNNSALDELAAATRNPRYKNLKTGPFKANYVVEKGKVVIEPFDVKVEDKQMEIWGEHSLTNTMDYRIKTTVAANELGSDVSGLVKLISDPNKQLPVTIVIRGDINKPKVSVDAKEALKTLQKDASKGIFNKLF